MGLFSNNKKIMSGLRESDTAAACNKNTGHTDL